MVIIITHRRGRLRLSARPFRFLPTHYSHGTELSLNIVISDGLAALQIPAKLLFTSRNVANIVAQYTFVSKRQTIKYRYSYIGCRYHRIYNAL